MFKDEDTQITIKDVPGGVVDPGLLSCLGFRQINEAENLKSIIKAEKEGYDAVAGACYFDSGIRAASTLLSIPVVGPAEASMHLAAMMGNKFAVITSEASWINEMEHHLMVSGFTAAAISKQPVRALALPMNDLFQCLMTGNHDPVKEDFIKVAERCLNDDADVIIAGCGLISPILTINNLTEIGGAPVIDPMIASLKMAELMGKFFKSGLPVKTKKGLFQTLPDELKITGLNELNLLVD
jgi:allantoin racemase